MSEFRRRLLMQSKSELPSGYTRLAYIEANGGQRLNTNVGFSETKIICDCQGQIELTGTQLLVSPGSSAAGFWFGTANKVYTGGSGAVFNEIPSNNRISVYIEFSKWDTTNDTIFRINGIEKTRRRGSASFSYPICLSNIDYMVYAKYYSLVIKDFSDNILFNGIPAIDSNGNVGLFDTITQQLFQSETSSQFIAGYE